MKRRDFLAGTASAAGAAAVVPRHVLGGPGQVAPNDKITVAHIGMGTQGFHELGALLAAPELQVVAVCDPNKDSNDYVEWGKGSVLHTIRTLLGNPGWRRDETGGVGGREVGREVVETYYAEKRGADRFKGVAAYADFRELLETARGVDAVKIMTPDHLHATIALAALKKGKHVATHKPIANRLAEGRLVLETARRSPCQTHLLAYGSGAANGQIVERIRAGAIGALREIHNWTNRPVWPQYTEIPADRPPVPAGFDWSLWLGPALDRPYHPRYTHTVFRGWYDFGGGPMADMGIYSLWPVFTGLDLDAPLSAQAWATHTCAIVDHVSRPVANDVAYPTACTIRFQFAAKGDRPAVELFWYDGGMKPRLPEVLESQGVEMAREGICFVGDAGAILAEFTGRSPRLYTRGKSEPLPLVERPAVNGLLTAFKSQPSPGSFLSAGPITDAVNLGAVALRAGKKVLFDSGAMKITNHAGANRYLTREYRPGWEL
jgi:predicted dehydrogenase